MQSRPSQHATESRYPLRKGSMSGVTLIELMMTLVVVTVLMMIAIPSFQGIIRTNRIAAMTNDMTAALQLTRSEAVTRGRRVTLCKSGNADDAAPTCSTSAADKWQDGWLIYVDTDNDGSFDDDGTEERLRVGQPNVTSATIDGGTRFANYVSFFSTGQSNTNGTLYICTPDNERRIIIGGIGRPRVCDPNDTDLCDLPSTDKCVCTNASPCP